MFPALNEDCSLSVIDSLAFDFRTLSRMLRVSKQMFQSTAPLMYLQLGSLANDGRILTWSLRKQRKCCALLLTSSGFLPDGYIPGKSSRDDGTLRVTMVVPETPQEDKWRWTRIPKFTTPLFSTRYFQWTRRLPGGLTTCMVLDVFGYGRYRDKEYFALHHAKALSTLIITGPQVALGVATFASRFSQLSLLEVNLFPEDTTAEITNALCQFVMDHKRIHPKRLVEIRGSENVELQLCLNEILEPKSIHFTSPILPFPGVDFEGKEGKGIFKNLTQIRFRDKSPPDDGRDPDWVSDDCLSPFINCCRHLEKLDVEIEDYSWAPWIQVFPFTKLSCQPPPPLKSLKIKGISCFEQDSMLLGFPLLEVLDYSGKHSTDDLFWSWPLVHLKVLNLDYCRIDIRQLDLCPQLEEVRLESVFLRRMTKSLVDTANKSNSNNLLGTNQIYFDDLEDDEVDGQLICWKPPTTLRVLHLLGGSLSLRFDFSQVAHLHLLQELSLGHSSSKDILKKIHPEGITDSDSLPSWNFDRLEKLTIEDEGAYNCWANIILPRAPRLKILKVYLAVFSNLDWIFSPPLVSGDGNDDGGDKEGCSSHRMHIQNTRIESLELACIHPEKNSQILYSMLKKAFFTTDIVPTSLSPTTTTLNLTPDLVLDNNCNNFPNLRQLRLGNYFPGKPSRAEFCAFIIGLMKRPKMELIEMCVTDFVSNLDEEVQRVSGDEYLEWDNLFLLDEFGSPKGKETKKSPFCRLVYEYDRRVNATKQYKLKR